MLAAPRAASPPNELLQAFPLNPTGERIVTPPAARAGVFRPPVREEAAARSVEPQSDSLPLAAIAGGVVALLSLGALVLILLARYARRGREVASGSAYISAVYVGTRYLPVIDAADRKRNALPRSDLVPAVVGSAIALVVALLVIAHVG